MSRWLNDVLLRTNQKQYITFIFGLNKIGIWVMPICDTHTHMHARTHAHTHTHTHTQLRILRDAHAQHKGEHKTKTLKYNSK